MAEAAVNRAVGRALDLRGAWWYRTGGIAGPSRRGLPDFGGSYRGRALALEAKGDGQISRQQDYELRKAQRAGAVTGVVRSGEDVHRLLDTVDQELDAVSLGVGG